VNFFIENGFFPKTTLDFKRLIPLGRAKYDLAHISDRGRGFEIYATDSRRVIESVQEQT